MPRVLDGSGTNDNHWCLTVENFWWLTGQTGAIALTLNIRQYSYNADVLIYTKQFQLPSQEGTYCKLMHNNNWADNLTH